MKTHLLLLSALALLLTSCASPLQRRISRNPELYSRLPDAEKQSVQRGEIREGMSKDAVFFMWGKPDRVSNGTREGKAFERWSYTNYEPVYRPMIYGGVGIYGACSIHDPYLYGGPVVDYVPTQGASVEFVNGKVSGFLIPR